MDRQQIVFASEASDPSLLILSVPSSHSSTGDEIQGFCTPLDARRGGLLLALPCGLLREDVLHPPGGFTEEDLVGPSNEFEVDMIEEDELGNAFASGFNCSILVADFTNSALGLLREYDPVTDSTTEIVSFVDGSPSAMPSAPELLTLALSWAHSADGRIHFYSAREEPPASKPAAPKKAGVKRVTTAILAEQLNALSAQVALLASEREEQNKQPVPPLPTRPQAFVDPATGRGDLGPAVAQRKMPPLSQGLATPARTTPAKALQLLGPPPKTRMSPLSMAVLADEPRTL